MKPESDEVDEIVAAWHEQLPSSDASAMHVWSRITRLGQLLADERGKIFASNDLGMWEFDVLAALRRAGEPYRMTAGQLVSATYVTSGTMTNRITRLSERGLVVRTKGQDKRTVYVQLSEEGMRLADASIRELTKLESKMLATLDETEREQLVSLLRRLLVDLA
ncbi:MarR family transcriptional regulator [Propionimicrobium lymphophilum]|uniref:HTH marR-type domain-containing protein n=1 Tax=Propionimicrobium lymphophilum ACS-093-V-SCH5 TaxID=883161 RepID=S2W0J2_9ACTN|nr:MarR family transcriptional regulator [Propionimicrobium lymphophilum]EPD33253.1 hypothetical protein HMPREF9306_00785 [Propionimicrobium lymphophilum ACS-093-V-SCH5]MDK7710037.1 MarR family transcriptional regulator [Propionimicrobium lymphophilum]MDK7732714.1 MarR family transcriptional regulator [Propionimicrobium lymphophilum]